MWYDNSSQDYTFYGAIHLVVVFNGFFSCCVTVARRGSLPFCASVWIDWMKQTPAIRLPNIEDYIVFLQRKTSYILFAPVCVCLSFDLVSWVQAGFFCISWNAKMLEKYTSTHIQTQIMIEFPKRGHRRMNDVWSAMTFLLTDEHVNAHITSEKGRRGMGEDKTMSECQIQYCKRKYAMDKRQIKREKANNTKNWISLRKELFMLCTYTQPTNGEKPKMQNYANGFFRPTPAH